MKFLQMIITSVNENLQLLIINSLSSPTAKIHWNYNVDIDFLSWYHFSNTIDLKLNRFTFKHLNKGLCSASKKYSFITIVLCNTKNVNRKRSSIETHTQQILTKFKQCSPWSRHLNQKNRNENKYIPLFSSVMVK